MPPSSIRPPCSSPASLFPEPRPPDRAPDNKERSARTSWSRQGPDGSPATDQPDTGRIPLDIFKIIIHCGLVTEPEPEERAHGTRQNGATLYFDSSRSAPIDLNRSRAQFLADAARLDAWDNGNTNVWTLPLRPLLDALRRQEERADVAE
jgi:hypothetical protein